MTEDELDERLGGLIENYAREHHRVEPAGRTLAEEIESARRDTAELLPDGVHSAGMLLRTALVDGRPVGWIWVSLPGTPRHPDTAWIYYIHVDPGHRGKRYAQTIIESAERELAALGVTRLGLNTVGDNTSAIRLYQRLGFRVTQQQMSKEVPGTAPEAG